ncbi:MAG: DUF1801 domain-containing protein [Acidimicrobiia bacterium]|nr:DUF1801 domain-containing protein [Acidimicrobiia bacterium]
MTTVLGSGSLPKTRFGAVVQSTAETPEQYLAELPDDRRDQIEEVRDVILTNLPHGYVEQMGWGMLAYVVPLEAYPDTYNKQPLMYAALASQKNHMAVYLSNIYADEPSLDWFRQAYLATGNKLDMGKSCVRFRHLDQLPLEVIGQAIARTPLSEFIAQYERARA